MKYQWIFFDADETLFSFDAFQGLRKMFAEYGVDFDQHHFDEYSLLNKPLWEAYQHGKISADELALIAEMKTAWGLENGTR